MRRTVLRYEDLVRLVATLEEASDRRHADGRLQCRGLYK